MQCFSFSGKDLALHDLHPRNDMQTNDMALGSVLDDFGDSAFFWEEFVSENDAIGP